MTTAEAAPQVAVLAAAQALAGIGAKAVPKQQEQQVAAKTGSAAAEAVSVAAPEPDVIKLFFVRVPRPAAEDSHVKQLHENFQAHVEQVRAINARLGAKREAMRTLKGQMSEARSVKGAARPEFDDKLNRLKLLRDQRTSVQNRISDIRGHVKGLQVKTEAELDKLIQQEEERIRFGGVTLREEKQVLAELSKLRSQRDKIKQYEQQKGSLAGLEAELAKVKSSIDELDAEFNMVKTEREAVAKVMSGLHTKLKALEQELEAEETQQKAIVEKKNDALAKLEAAKEEREAGQADYRENRKFSLQVRELLDRGEVDEARVMCEQQTGEWMTKLLRDSAAWGEYCDAVAHSRRQLVSELLPNSSVAVMEAEAKAKAAAAADKAAADKAAPADSAAAKKAAGAKAGAAKAAGPAPAAAAEAKAVPVADSAGKAKDLIAAIMSQAKEESQRIKASADAASELGSEGPSEDASGGDAKDKEREVVAAPAKPAAAGTGPARFGGELVGTAKFVENPAQKAAQIFNFKMEVLKVAEVEVIPLPPKAEQQVKTRAETVEEQRLKAAEAEARKKKRQDANERKRLGAKAAEAQRKVEEARAKEAQAARELQQQQQQVEVKPEPVAEPAVKEAEQPAAESAAPVAAKVVAQAPSAVAKLVPPSAKRPAAKPSVLRQLKKVCQEHQGPLVVVAFFMLLLAMLMFAA